MKVKICGIRRSQDLKACLEKGADLVGFINIKRSPRMVGMEEINELVSSLPDKEKAVLVIEPKDILDAEQCLSKSELTTLQVHSLSPNEIREIKSDNSVKIIRSVGISTEIKPRKEKEIQEFARSCDFLLFDYQVDGRTGGTGRQIPLETAIQGAKIAKNANRKIKLFLAGGMDIVRMEKEGKIIGKHFDYVDFNSGVETKPGIKSSAKIKQIIDVNKQLNSKI